MNSPNTIRFSVIIPAYNEEKFLPRLLESIEVARSNYKTGEIEVIVADNSSTDKTAAVASNYGCRVERVEKRVIAAARNGGAKAARGEIFCFIDADSALHPHTFEKIDQIISDERIIAGATGVYLERKSPGILLVYCLMVPFLWLTGMDTGVVFCRREDFEAIGGYDENLLLAEDVNFLLALKRRGRLKKQKLTRLTGVKALGSTRKFDEHGDWHYFSFFRQIIFKLPFLIKFSLFNPHFRSNQENLREFADEYWYKPQR